MQKRQYKNNLQTQFGVTEIPSDNQLRTIISNIQYDNGKQTQNVTAEIKIKKDEQILVSIRFLGITMAKALITPSSVSYYEKMNGTYFEGDFTMLSNWLGTDLDFTKVQNLFLGKAIDDLSKGKWISEINEKLFKLSKASTADLSKDFYFEAANFLLKKETITQASQNRVLEIQYPSYKEVERMFLPNEINIKAAQKDKIAIDIAYKNTTFNENLSYSFSIPSDYRAIQID